MTKRTLLAVRWHSALAAGILLAMAFTFSCSGDDSGRGDEPSSSSVAAAYSSSGGGSSSSVPNDNSSSSSPTEDDNSSSSDNEGSSSSEDVSSSDSSSNDGSSSSSNGNSSSGGGGGSSSDGGNACTSWNWLETTPATCNAPGIETKTCTTNSSITDGTREIDKLEWGKWEITSPASPGLHATGQRTCPNGETDTKNDLTICGEDEYSPAEEFCRDGEVLELCGTAHYDADQFCDTRDNKLYSFKLYNMVENTSDQAWKIGPQAWMTENLNYAAGDSKCYGDIPANCEKYGRLYNWTTASGGSASSTAPSGVQGICPTGWHLPSYGEVQALAFYASDNTNFAGTNIGPKLKAVSEDWNGSSVTPTYDYDFSGLPGGTGNSDDTFQNGVGDPNAVTGNWWTTTNGTNTNNARRFQLSTANNNLSFNTAGVSKLNLHSVRCVKN